MASIFFSIRFIKQIELIHSNVQNLCQDNCVIGRGVLAQVLSPVKCRERQVAQNLISPIRPNHICTLVSL